MCGRMGVWAYGGRSLRAHREAAFDGISRPQHEVQVLDRRRTDVTRRTALLVHDQLVSILGDPALDLMPVAGIEIHSQAVAGLIGEGSRAAAVLSRV